MDGFILETFSDLHEVEAALCAVKALSDLPVIAQMTVGHDGNTSYGTTVETIGSRLTELGADVVGLNCSVGPAAMLDAIERMVERTDRPLSAQPNAGLAPGSRRPPDLPREPGIHGLLRPADDPGRGALRRGLLRHHPRSHQEDPRLRGQPAAPPRLGRAHARGSRRACGRQAVVPLGQRSGLGRKLGSGELVTTVEILPPKGWNPAEMIEQCRTLQAAGVDAVNILDSARAQSRMGVLPAALIVQREVGLETVFHYTCRDRNMLGMLSDLLGAAAGGLRNVLIVTGDPPAMGPYPDSTAVFDIDSIGLTNLVRRLNQGLDPGGNPIGRAHQIRGGCRPQPGGRPGA